MARFFSGSALDFVKNSRYAEKTQEEADFVQQALGLPLNAKILDAPCGGGRLSLEMASRDIKLPLWTSVYRC